MNDCPPVCSFGLAIGAPPTIRPNVGASSEHTRRQSRCPRVGSGGSLLPVAELASASEPPPEKVPVRSVVPSGSPEPSRWHRCKPVQWWAVGWPCRERESMPRRQSGPPMLRPTNLHGRPSTHLHIRIDGLRPLTSVQKVCITARPFSISTRSVLTILQPNYTAERRPTEQLPSTIRSVFSAVQYPPPLPLNIPESSPLQAPLAPSRDTHEGEF